MPLPTAATHRPRSGCETTVLVMRMGVTMLGWTGPAPLGAQLTLYPAHLQCILLCSLPRCHSHTSHMQCCITAASGCNIPYCLSALLEHLCINNWPSNVFIYIHRNMRGI